MMKTSDKWVEISLVVDGELAEAVAEVFSRFAPQGVVIESTQIAEDPTGEGYPTGPMRVFAYIPMDKDFDDTQQRLEQAMWYMGRISSLPALQYRTLGEVDWVSVWKQHYQPIPLGKRLIILPAWIKEYPRDRIPIRIDPGMAFGTGTHPSTQLCLQLAEELILSAGSDPSDLLVMDIGCGSGILSIGALKLGAYRALGVDVDPQAVKNARKNADANNLTGRLELGVGSVSEILAGQFSIRQAPLIFTNILASVIIRLFEQGLSRLVAPRGSLILSGIMSGQEGDVEDTLKEHGFELVQNRQIGEWIALLAEKPA